MNLIYIGYCENYRIHTKSRRGSETTSINRGVCRGRRDCVECHGSSTFRSERLPHHRFGDRGVPVYRPSADLRHVSRTARRLRIFRGGIQRKICFPQLVDQTTRAQHAVNQYFRLATPANCSPIFPPGDFIKSHGGFFCRPITIHCHIHKIPLAGYQCTEGEWTEAGLRRALLPGRANDLSLHCRSS